MYLYNPKTSKYVSYNRQTRLVTPTVGAAQATELTEEEAINLLARCTKKLKDFQCVQELKLCMDGTVQPLTSEDGNAQTLKKVKRRPFRPTERISIYTRDRGICGICGEFVPPNEATIDHIVPISKGGTYALENLQCCCRRCNLLKADALPDDFFNLLVDITEYQVLDKKNKKMRKAFKKIFPKAKAKAEKKKNKKEQKEQKKKGKKKA